MKNNLTFGLLFSTLAILVALSSLTPIYAQNSLDGQASVSVDNTYSIEAENKNQIEETVKAVRDSILKLVKESLDDRIGSNNTNLAQIEYTDELLDKQYDSNYSNLKSLVINSLNIRLDLLESENEMKISSTVEIQCDNFENPTADSCLYQLILRD